ncbi:DUF3313 family protein [Geomonas azotofigens]|uniref:DUF3313 family protein n=1 Tax=Geomonas azotofigens TaxID=2843196 RepID=UPI001C11BDF5|nr:DUF3313 family protein [Geomonas azotofigens]MBU5613890.1 DUF3313 domain-containing protein [Geomonas azotofigens]
MKSKTVGVTALSLWLSLGAAFRCVPNAHANAAQPAETGLAAAKATTNKDLNQYQKVMLLPAEFESGNDAGFKGVPVLGQHAMAAYLTGRMAADLKGKGVLTETSGPGVARLKLVVNHLEVKPKRRSAGPPPPPFPLPEMPPGPDDDVFTAMATVTASFIDSQTGETVTSFATKEKAKGGPVEALPKALDKVVLAIGKRMERSAGSAPGKEDPDD